MEALLDKAAGTGPGLEEDEGGVASLGLALCSVRLSAGCLRFLVRLRRLRSRAAPLPVRLRTMLPGSWSASLGASTAVSSSASEPSTSGADT